MASIAATGAMVIVEAEYIDYLQNYTEEVTISRDTLQRIKGLFERFRVENVYAPLNEMVDMLQRKYGFDNTIFLYESSIFPKEIRLYRTALYINNHLFKTNPPEGENA